LREPVDRELSWYRYRVRRFKDGYDSYYASLNGTSSAHGGASSLPSSPSSLSDYIEETEMSVVKWIDCSSNVTVAFDTDTPDATALRRNYSVKTFQEEMEDTILKEYGGIGGGDARSDAGIGGNSQSASSTLADICGTRSSSSSRQAKRPTILLSDYAHYLRKWFHLFDRSNQILVLSFDELRDDPISYLKRIHRFLDIPIPSNETLLTVPHSNSSPQIQKEKGQQQSQTPTSVNTFTTVRTVTIPSSSITDSTDSTQHELASKVYNERNEELYKLLEQYPGPSMEQRPFRLH
jgi:hypothetical protein